MQAVGYVLGWLRGPDGDYSFWQYFVSRYGVQDLASFVGVAYIHNASYLGGFVGLVIALLLLRGRKPVPVSDHSTYGQPTAHRASEYDQMQPVFAIEQSKTIHQSILIFEYKRYAPLKV